MNGVSVLEQPRISSERHRLFGIGRTAQIYRKPRPERVLQENRLLQSPVAVKKTVLDSLQSSYVIDNRTEVASFIENNQLTGVLVRAIDPIQKAFGTSTLRKLTILEDDDGDRTLFCLVAFPGTLEDAQTALDSFDRDWWVSNAKYASKLNFDYRLV